MSMRELARWAPAVALTAWALGGCASPGDPLPRVRPIVPEAIKDLAARQQGNEVVLSFTLPTRTTRNEPLAATPSIDIYGGTVEPGGKPAEKVATRLVYTIPAEMTNSYLSDGKIVYHDEIPRT